MAKAHGNGSSRPTHAYPRPQLVRDAWTSLNGSWDFALDPEALWQAPDEARFDRRITVPFAPETPASGVEETGLYRAVWYRRKLTTPALPDGGRLILHFGAVDWHARVWVNGHLAVEHEGGYTPFLADITPLLNSSGENELVVRAFDDPLDMAKPRGKQDWLPEPHSIWYYRTTGIWQTVWMEQVSSTYISRIKWTPDLTNWSIATEVETAGTTRDDLRLRLRLSHAGQTIVDDTFALSSNPIKRILCLPDPGIDDARHRLLWAPDHPNLIDARLDLLENDGQPLDSVRSYTALRSVCCQGDRFILNTRPYPLRMVLDQGYWPESGLTAPNDDALRKDVELAKAMGFNGVRKHQKVEDPRYFYWADTLGLLVWEEMPSPYTFAAIAIERLTKTWTEILQRDHSHPSIVALVPFNESWGVPDLPESAAQRNFVKGVYFLTRALDPSRPVVGNDGWESVVTDIIAIHDYDADPRRIAQRYSAPFQTFASQFQERPGHRVVILDPENHENLPIMLTEFGGIAYSKDRGTWGYSRAKTADDFAARYADLLESIRSLPLLAGFCYTQFTDTYQEANGLLYMDRTPKLPLEEIAIATRGAQSDAERRLQNRWRQRLLHMQTQQTKSLHTTTHE